MTDTAAAPAAPTAAQQTAPALTAALDTLPLTLTVRVGRATLTVGELSSLAKGDTLTLGTRIDEPLEVCIEDRVVARGVLEEAESGLALRLTEVAG